MGDEPAEVPRLHAHLIQPPAPGPARVLDGALTRVRWSAGPTVAPGAEVLVGGWPTAAQLEQVNTLVIPFSGLPQRTRRLLLERPRIAVYNLHHNAPVVAELALAMLLAVTKRLLPMDRALRAGDWGPRTDTRGVATLAGRRAVVLGFGAVGRATARLLKGIGLRVIGVGRRAQRVEGFRVEGLDALPSLLPGANVLVLAVPHTVETEGMVDADLLRQLPDGAAVINVARAAVLDPDALFAELASGRLCAGIDVWYRYPTAGGGATLPAEQPFHTLDNVVLSPHRGGLVQDTEILRMRAVARVLDTLAGRGQPATRVDVVRGY